MADSRDDSDAVLSEENTKLTFYYDTQKSVRNGMDIGPFGLFDQCWNGHAAEITSVTFDESFADCNTLTNTDYWFHGCEKLTTLNGIANLNTGNVTSMEGMFCECKALTSIDVSHFDTSNVTNMTNMFSLCGLLTNLDVSNFDTKKARTMSYMFMGCGALSNLDVSHFDTSNGKQHAL